MVTIDAIGTQTEIATTIIDLGGDYLLSVKENQPELYEDLERLFSMDEQVGFASPEYSHTRKVDNSHGRMEIPTFRTPTGRINSIFALDGPANE